MNLIVQKYYTMNKNVNKIIKLCISMTSLFKCHCCNAIKDKLSKDKRFKQNTCITCGDKQKKEELSITDVIKTDTKLI
jgi:translation initiation factor 2 beta subunit (eIF-2beta)/eIF-5